MLSNVATSVSQWIKMNEKASPIPTFATFGVAFVPLQNGLYLKQKGLEWQ